VTRPHGTRRYRRSEARVRLHAVWRAWESLRLDPAIGIARWLRDVADPQMDRLRNPEPGAVRRLRRPAPSAPRPAPVPRAWGLLGRPRAEPLRLTYGDDRDLGDRQGHRTSRRLYFAKQSTPAAPIGSTGEVPSQPSHAHGRSAIGRRRKRRSRSSCGTDRVRRAHVRPVWGTPRGRVAASSSPWPATSVPRALQLRRQQRPAGPWRRQGAGRSVASPRAAHLPSSLRGRLLLAGR